MLEIPADAYLLFSLILIGYLLLKSRVLQAHWLILGNNEKATLHIVPVLNLFWVDVSGASYLQYSLFFVMSTVAIMTYISLLPRIVYSCAACITSQGWLLLVCPFLLLPHF